MRRITPAEADTLAYIGSENPDGSIWESVLNSLDRAIDPVYMIEDGCKHYFESAKETTQ
jgi:hypothetical protein